MNDVQHTEIAVQHCRPHDALRRIIYSKNVHCHVTLINSCMRTEMRTRIAAVEIA